MPAQDPDRLGRVGFAAQNLPVYAGMTVAEHCRLRGLARPEMGHGARPRGDPLRVQERIAAEAIEAVGLRRCEQPRCALQQATSTASYPSTASGPET